MSMPNTEEQVWRGREQVREGEMDEGVTRSTNTRNINAHLTSRVALCVMDIVNRH